MSYTDEQRRQLSMFGVRQTPSGEWKPILERVDTNRCTKCSGFGTYGNPLCGAVYTCSQCGGTGTQPEGLPAAPPAPAEPKKKVLWEKLRDLFR